MKAKQPPKAVTVEDSFKSCTSLDATRHILQILAPDLLARLHEEFQVTWLCRPFCCDCRLGEELLGFGVWGFGGERIICLVVESASTLS